MLDFPDLDRQVQLLAPDAILDQQQWIKLYPLAYPRQGLLYPRTEFSQ